jgi:hypothetical protein
MTTKRRLLRWSLILVALAAFAIWLEPTRVVWGWLRGEAFYQGRPTSYWAAELAHWDMPVHPPPKDWGSWRLQIWISHAFSPTSAPIEERFKQFRDWLLPPNEEVQSRTAEEFVISCLRGPPLLSGDAAARPVLEQLAQHRDSKIRAMAEYGLARVGDP